MSKSIKEFPQYLGLDSKLLFGGSVSYWEADTNGNLTTPKAIFSNPDMTVPYVSNELELDSLGSTEYPVYLDFPYGVIVKDKNGDTIKVVGWIDSGGSSGSTDGKVKVSADDTISKYLSGKLTSGSDNVSLDVSDPGGDEAYLISVYDYSIDIDANTDLININTDNIAINASDIIDLETSITNLEHNDTQGKQGGTTGEYYHLTSVQHSELIEHVGMIDADNTLKSVYMGENITLDPAGTVTESNNYAIGKDIDIEGGNNYAFGSVLTKDENTSNSVLIGYSSNMSAGSNGVVVGTGCDSISSPNTHIFGSCYSNGNRDGALIGIDLSVTGIEDIVVVGKNIDIIAGDADNVHIGTDAIGESTKIHGEEIKLGDAIAVSSTLIDIYEDVDIDGDLTVVGEISSPNTNYTTGWTVAAGIENLTFYKAQKHQNMTVQLRMQFGTSSTIANSGEICRRTGNVFGITLGQALSAPVDVFNASQSSISIVWDGTDTVISVRGQSLANSSSSIWYRITNTMPL